MIRPHRSVLSSFVLLAVASTTAAAPEGEPFPLAELMPKEETGATAFLADHPKYDGRGIVVAVFDTGVDPGAAGLQVTSDGKPKIIDLVDGSGSGDVVTTTVRKVEGGKVEGLTGRELKLGKWKIPSGEVHVGSKAAWEIYPGALVTRMKGKRKERWDAEQRERVAEAREVLRAFDEANPKPTAEQLRDREEKKARLDLLEGMGSDYDDPGPVFDCVVFHDGKNWRAAVDTDEDGDFSDEKAMANYRALREWATFDAESLYNFALNVYEDGNLLSIVSDCGAHGTHVAGIVAANHPDRPELNGIAPGAQIVAVKIGDTRMGSSSMSTGQVRGLVATLENECDLINMSYGGSSPLANRGHIIDLYEEIVYDEGVIFVASAGNEGPALSTAGSPGGTSSCLIGVGAYVSAEMMRAQYSVREALPDTHYTWSSRGPTTDGDLGVDISAPGGYIAPVPNWSLQPSSLKNGTSMSAPSTCGGIALLLSGMKDKGQTWTPQHVKRAIQNTAADVPGVEPFAAGRGLLRIDRAWDWLQAHRPYSDTGLRFDVSIASRDDARGIYLREAEETGRVTEVVVTVDPHFRRDVDNREKVDFQADVTIAADADWVQVPDVMHLQNGGRTFRVRVDPRGLPVGVHYAEVTGTDVARPNAGPIFRVPVTVIRTTDLTDGGTEWSASLDFAPGQIRRQFFAVPEGATWADLEIRAGDFDSPRRFVVHTVQLEPGMQWDAHASELWRWYDPGQERVHSFAVEGGRTLEVTLAHYWSSLGDADFSFHLTFHGLDPREEHLFVDGAFPAARSSVRASLREESVSPSAKADVGRRMLRPTKSVIRPLPGNRDLLPRGKREHELVLTYEFEMEGDGEVRAVSTLNQDERLWEYWESGIWLIFDAGKRRVAVGPSRSWAKLAKGKYTLLYHVRHPDVSGLEELRGLSMALDRKLGKAVTLPVHADAAGAYDGSAKFGARELRRGEEATFWVGSPAFGELPAGTEAGDELLGTITYGEEREDTFGAGRRPGGFDVTVRIPPAPEKEKDPKASDEDDADDADGEADGDGAKSKLGEELRDLQVMHLAELYDKERRDDFDALATRILEGTPDHLPVYLERVRRLDAAKDDDRDGKALVAACDDVIARIDAEKVAAAIGVDVDPEDKAGKKVRKEREEQRDWLAEALSVKAKALMDEGTGDETSAAAFEETFRELDRWVDTTDDDHADLHIERERRRGRIATALDLLNDRIDDADPDRERYEKRIALLTELGWGSWAAYEKQWLLRRFADDFPPF
ncbi:S8 family serine peptidase [bacterium]|nr:S8 family serine peptidase [bacterium]